MEGVKGILRGVVSDIMKKHDGIDFQDALAAWNKVAGQKAAAHTQIVYLTKEKIRINVDSSAWLYELNLQKERIIKELSKILHIKDVRFRLGDVEKVRSKKV